MGDTFRTVLATTVITIEVETKNAANRANVLIIKCLTLLGFGGAIGTGAIGAETCCLVFALTATNIKTPVTIAAIDTYANPKAIFTATFCQVRLIEQLPIHLFPKPLLSTLLSSVKTVTSESTMLVTKLIAPNVISLLAVFSERSFLFIIR